MKANEFVIEYENHGRHLEEADVSRTTGWFTVMYPMKLVLTTESIGQQIQEIKMQLKSIPHHGIGYGSYRQQHDRSLPTRAQLRFNYMGQFGRELNNSLFSYCQTDHGPETDPANDITAVLEFILFIIDGELKIDLFYSSKAYKQSTVRQVMEALVDHLHEILIHLAGLDDYQFSPVDFSLDLSQKELEVLFH